MANSLSVPPVVLVSSCLLTLFVGVFLGFQFSNNSSLADRASNPLITRKADSSALALEGASIKATASESDLSADGLVAMSSMSAEIADLQAFLQMGQIDPIAAAKEALAEANDLDRISKLALLLSEASSEDMPGIAELISKESNDFERMQQARMLYYAWGQMDAPSAVAYAEILGNGRFSRMASSVALSSWASLDPASARAWVDKAENPSDYQRGLLIGWSESNPLQALQYLSSLDGETDLMDRWTAPQIANNLISQRGVLALDDLAAMPATRNRNELIERLADELGESNPAAAAVRLASIDDPEVLNNAVPELVQEWAQNDPKAAIEFVSGYQESNTQLYARAMAEVIEEWAERDPYEAGVYLNEQPASPELDRSVAEYSREVARVDPYGAMSFAVSVNDDNLRETTIRRVARDWMRVAPKGYEEWASANPELVPSERN